MTPIEESIAEAAGLLHGDVVLEVDDTPVDNSYELLVALEASLTEGALLKVQRGNAVHDIELPAAVDVPYGIRILRPTTVGSADPGTPAAGIGLQRGDRITAVDGTFVASWYDMRMLIMVRPEESITLAWERDGVDMTSTIVPEERMDGDERIGVIGIRPFEAGSIEVGWWEATRLGAASVYTSSYLILDFIGSIFQDGRYKELGGPIRIAKMADDTAQMGLKYFLRFLALLSVNLGVLNLLRTVTQGNWGLAIILLTVLVKLCLHPITRKNQRGMMRMGKVMGKIKPEMDALQEKYGEDRMKYSQEVQKLWKKHDVNPGKQMLGCLVIFLQMPIWIGIIWSLDYTVELRQASFLWIQDLTRPDMLDRSIMGSQYTIGLLDFWPFYGHLNILPILYVILTLVNQSLQPRSKEPQAAAQQKMMKFMMLFMGVMFFRVASGLCIYFIASNCVSWVI